MHAALEQAEKAEEADEVPIGAVVLDSSGQQLAKGHNAPITSHDPTAHAEIVALRRAGQAVANYRLPGSILVSTLEPCFMCVGALVQARVAGVVFGARDPKSGALVSRMRFPLDYPWINHAFWILEGVCRRECENILSQFFTQRRSKGSIGK
ncbi:MAG: tRNA adenosine(34) deaminase TadA [Desulfovermiculus sp.]|nr:tRNA adenosine(34) deaminase TadA [Desulfovermiculus sp.]